ncbi:peptidase [Xanthomonas campestris]|uniref:peptidase n=1 Tax=Xanthomonas campestris TaxID=339 RepID=UPI00388F3279
MLLAAVLSFTDVCAAVAISPLQQQDMAANATAFFPSVADEQIERAALSRSLEDARQHQNGGSFERFSVFEELFGRCLKHHGYFQLLSLQNTGDAAASESLDRVDEICEAASNDARSVLLATPDSEPWTRRYLSLRERAERARAHAVKEDAKALADTASDNIDRLSRLHGLILQTPPFERIAAGRRHLDAYFDYITLMRDPEPAVRRQAWFAYWKGIRARSQPFAEILLGIVQNEQAIAHAKGYADAPASRYAAMGLDREAVEASLHAMARHASSWQAYSVLQGSVPWDRVAPPNRFTHHLTLHELAQVGVRAVAPLGDNHAGQLLRLLDSDNGRMDISQQRRARAMDAFSITAPGAPSVLFVGYRRDDLESDVEVIHEAAHAVHGELMNEAGTSPLTRNGPSWMMESFAILDELLFRQQLAQEARTPQARDYYLRSLIDDLALQLFTSAEEAQLELAIYDGVASGSLNSADDLNAVTDQVLSHYERSSSSDAELGMTWATKRLFYQDPMYLTNYLYAGLVAVKLLSLTHAEDATFQARYRALEEQGFGRDPVRALEETLGGQIDWNRLIDEDIVFFDHQVDALRALRSGQAH